MRKILLPLVLGAALLAWAPQATAGSPRADTYYTVFCTDSEGNLVEAESVDANAVERGGKDHAVELFTQNFPFDWTCWLEGPFTP